MSSVEKTDVPHPIVQLSRKLDAMDNQLAAVLPDHMPVERFKRMIITTCQQFPELLECEPKSFRTAFMRAAADGLYPDGREGAMVVRRSAGAKTVTWQPMIAGIRKKARNSGEITTWDAHLVHQGDHFEFQLGDNPQINHTYDLLNPRGPMIGAYSVCVLKDGSKSFEVMSIDDIHAIRDRSDAWKAFKAGKIKSTPWSTDEGEMARKTVARRHSKMLPMSTDLEQIIRRDDEDGSDESEHRAEQQIPQSQPRLVLQRQLENIGNADPQTGEIIEGASATTSAASEAGAAHSPPSSRPGQYTKNLADMDAEMAKAETLDQLDDIAERTREQWLSEAPDIVFENAKSIYEKHKERVHPSKLVKG